MQFTDLFSMTCVFCRLEDCLDASKQLKVVFKKRNLNFAFAFEHVALTSNSESTFPSNISFHKS